MTGPYCLLQLPAKGTKITRADLEQQHPVHGVETIEGPPGPKGDQGIQGIQGPAGTDGQDGPTGPRGDPGTPGAKGDTGNQGIQGIPGQDSTVPGPQGNPGIDGEDGAPGLKGDTGEAGYTPVKGVDYFDGAKGDTGDQGIKGDTGPQGNAGASDISHWRKAGVTTYEAWYTMPNTGLVLTAGAVTVGRLYAFPFLTPKAITVDRIAFNVTTLLAGKARAGIYNDAGMRPGSLLVDGGEMDTGTTGVKAATINQALAGSGLYWLAFLANAAVTVRILAVGGVLPILGCSSALGTAPNFGMYMAQTYGALPGTFSASPSMITGTPIVGIFVRLSA